jgi:hypothetical protein
MPEYPRITWRSTAKAAPMMQQQQQQQQQPPLPSPSASSNPIPLRSALKHASSPRLQSPVLLSEPPEMSIDTPLSQSSGFLATSPGTATAASAAASVRSPSTFTQKVSFDTFENPAASMFSFTLSVKSDGYQRNRSTRVFLCAASPDESGREALDWALESFVQDGDELIVYRGVEQDELGERLRRVTRMHV